MQELAKREGFRRMNGAVWKINKQQQYKRTRIADSYDIFVNRVLSGNPVFLRNPKQFADVIKYLEVMQNPDFAFLDIDVEYIGFKTLC